MEILSTTTHMGEYIFYILFASLMSLVLLIATVAGFVEIFHYKNRDKETILVTLGILIFTLLIMTNGAFIIKDGAIVTHEAKVTDWNEVYEQDYKVVKQKGELITIQSNKWGK